MRNPHLRFIGIPTGDFDPVAVGVRGFLQRMFASYGGPIVWEIFHDRPFPLLRTRANIHMVNNDCQRDVDMLSAWTK
jgi:hypothetical protein